MDYISTKELAERWNVSVTRILNLVKEGRLSGAKLIGKSWVFPSDIEKPGDRRRKENRSAANEHEFRFPIYLYYEYSKEEKESGFTGDERTLYRAEQLFFTGKYRECCEMLTDLVLNTSDRYVQFGALYCLCLSSINLRSYHQAGLYQTQLYKLFEREEAHKKELEFIIHDLETYSKGNVFYLDQFSIGSLKDYPIHMRPYLLVESAYSDMLKAVFNGKTANTIPYEFCLELENTGFSPLSELLFHLYIAGIYMAQEDIEKAAVHLRRSCRIAEENEMEHSIAFLMHYAENLFSHSLGDQNPEQLKRLRGLAEEFINALNGLFEYSKKYNVLQNLDTKDSSLIDYARKGFTNKEISALMNLSMTTISKRYSVLYEKTGTHSKSELLHLYEKAIREF